MNLHEIDEKYAVYGMLFSLTNRIQTYGDSQFEDITMKQHFLLIGLGAFGDHYPTLKEMGELIGCSYQNVKRMALNLEKNGYLTLESDEKDKRKIKLVPTEKISLLAEQKKEESEQFMEKLYHGITKEQLKVTMETLILMDRNIGGKME